MFRKITIPSVFIIVSFFLLACSAPETQNAGTTATRSVLETILERGSIRVGTTGDFNPMSFKDPDTGNYAGHDVELIQRLASDMGVEIEWVATDWKNLVSGIAAGKYDITTGASYNMGRAKTAGYTLPVVQVGTVPLTLRSNLSMFDGWDSIDQADVSVAVTLGTVFDDQAKSLFRSAELKAVESPARDFQEVLAGRALVSITSNFEASQLIKTYPELAIIPIDAPKYANSIGLLAPQKDQVFINYLNVWIRMQYESGFLDELEEKWLSLGLALE